MRLSRRAALASGAALAIAPGARAEDAALAAAIAAPGRSAHNQARDAYRHPAALLAFFGIAPTQSVLEIEPGAGYWTEILAPYLAPHGHYTAALPSGTKYAAYEQQEFAKLVQGNPACAKASVTSFGADGAFAASGPYDLVLSFRNLHDWMAFGIAPAMLHGIHAVLKPGGTFGIEDHRAPQTQPQDPRAKSGYVRPDYAKTLIEAAGFTLVATSELGANPRDTKSYPDGVWDLPPVLKQGATDRAKYLAIGESDRWTMKFAKPG